MASTTTLSAPPLITNSKLLRSAPDPPPPPRINFLLPLPQAPRFPSPRRIRSKSFSVSSSSSSSSSSSCDSPAHLQVPSTINCSSPAASTGWSEFARNVSGEWDGYGAEFSVDGKPVELPESVVPEAFREWEVKLFDWQTQCPTLARPEEPEPAVSYKLVRLLPTVGCEADAAMQYSIDQRNIGGINSRVSEFAYESTGCYVAVWPKERLLELEHCLVDPQNKKSRVRIIQHVGFENCNKKVLQKIEVFCEQWYGPFRNGEQLGGCAIRDSAFASMDAMRSFEVCGAWQQGQAAVASFSSSQINFFKELIDTRLAGQKFVIRNEGDIILLPKKLWCSLIETEDGGVCGEVGWKVDQAYAITSRCMFSSHAKLKEIVIAHETAQFYKTKSL